jgi:phage baseplate assembly protein W
MAEIPHLRFPLSVQNGRFEVVEQDSAEDYLQRVGSVLRYPLGLRVDLPDFGLSEQAFRPGGADVDEIRAAIETWEPDAPISIEEIQSLAQAETSEMGVQALSVLVEDPLG